jgi:hypothetical protein
MPIINSFQRPSGGGVSIDGDFHSPLRRSCAAADFGDATEDRSVEVSRAALVANADGQIFEYNETPFVPHRLAIDSPLAHSAAAMLTSKVVHTAHLTWFRKS